MLALLVNILPHFQQMMFFSSLKRYAKYKKKETKRYSAYISGSGLLIDLKGKRLGVYGTGTAGCIFTYKYNYSQLVKKGYNNEEMHFYLYGNTNSGNNT